MVGTTLELQNFLQEDSLGCDIANKWVAWDSARNSVKGLWRETQSYIYATDTTTTTNASLPWKNTTTIPKLTQIRDNLLSNYIASLLPKSKWLSWEAGSETSNGKAKREAILAYMNWAVGQNRFRADVVKLVLDYIDYGNAFGTVSWVDQRPSQPEVSSGASLPQTGYVGPAIQRISPTDIVFNPTASSFLDSPKIVRSLVTLGELKRIIDSQSHGDEKVTAQALYDYLIDIRKQTRGTPTIEFNDKDTAYQLDGFSSFRDYLESDTVELLTFYGDIFDWETQEFLRNYRIVIVDRHKVISKEQNPSVFGYPPIFHMGWRPRQDNLWAMGPLDNLLGMQYRIDHIENLKADVFDLVTYPPLKIKGYVEDFEWAPMARIVTGDDGDVEMMAPPFQILQANIEIQNLMALMEEMAGSPKEAMGFRTPGEKTAYEVQRLENAASRIYQNKILQFSDLIERLLNAMLELARRNITAVQSVPVFDDDFKAQIFMDLSPADLTGDGIVRPVAARHFAEQAELIQNLTAFFSSAVGQDEQVRSHFSALKTAQLIESALNLTDYQLVQPNIRVTESADTQRLMQVAQEKVAMEAQTPSGLTPDDYDASLAGTPEMPAGMPQ